MPKGRPNAKRLPLGVIFCRCPACGYFPWYGQGHRFGGKKTLPKTRWCLGEKEETDNAAGSN